MSGVREASRIHHQTIHAGLGRDVDPIDRLSFDVCVENIELVVMLVCVRVQVHIQLGRGGGAIDVRFPLSQVG